MNAYFRESLRFALVGSAIIVLLALMVLNLLPLYGEYVAPRADGRALTGLHGFFMGAVHSFGQIVNLVMSYFNPKYSIYQGAGPAYDTGFVLGLGLLVHGLLFTLRVLLQGVGVVSRRVTRV